MNGYLASDLQNPDFVNPRNPDELLNTDFYMREVDVLDTEKTQYVEIIGANGYKQRVVDGQVFQKKAKVPYVKIYRAGDTTTIIDVEVREDHKRRWPNRWMAWQMQEGLIDNGANVPGWSIDEWAHLQPDQKRELRYLGFHTVEQIAGSSDAQVQRMGMGGMGLRDAARKAVLARANADAAKAMDDRDAKHAEEMAAMRKEMEELKAMLKSKKAA